MALRPAKVEQQYFSLGDAAAYVALHVRTVRQLIAEGKIRAYRPTGTPRGDIRISRSELDQYIASTAVRTAGD